MADSRKDVKDVKISPGKTGMFSPAITVATHQTPNSSPVLSYQQVETNLTIDLESSRKAIFRIEETLHRNQKTLTDKDNEIDRKCRSKSAGEYQYDDALAAKLKGEKEYKELSQLVLECKNLLEIEKQKHENIEDQIKKINNEKGRLYNPDWKIIFVQSKFAHDIQTKINEYRSGNTKNSLKSKIKKELDGEGLVFSIDTIMNSPKSNWENNAEIKKRSSLKDLVIKLRLVSELDDVIKQVETCSLSFSQRYEKIRDKLTDIAQSLSDRRNLKFISTISPSEGAKFVSAIDGYLNGFKATADFQKHDQALSDFALEVTEDYLRDSKPLTHP